MKAFLGLALALAGCGMLKLRPVNPNHAARKLEVAQTLKTNELNLDSALRATEQQCGRLDNDVTGFTATSIVLGVLGGGSGLTSIFTDSTPRIITGGIAVGLSASTALFSYLSTSFSQKYAHLCTVNTGGK